MPAQLEYEIELETRESCCRARVVLEDDCILRVISAVALEPRQEIKIKYHDRIRVAEVVDVTTSVAGYRATLHVADVCVHR